MKRNQMSKAAAWTQEITNEEWDKFHKVALRAAAKRHTSLGADDYAATAIAKLLNQKERPVNIEAWLNLTVSRLLIDRFRKVNGRGGESLRGLDDHEIESKATKFLGVSPSLRVANLALLRAVLENLPDKEAEIFLLFVQGMENDEIAIAVGYKDGKSVATKLGQIRKRIKNFYPKIE